MTNTKKLRIGDLIVDKPIIQGGMGVGISLSSLAGSVAAYGGIGLISTAQIGYRKEGFEKNPLNLNIEALKEELKKARNIEKVNKILDKDDKKGAVGFNIMVATKGYEMYCETAVAHGADIIVSGAGLALDLPVYLEKGMAKREEIPDEQMYGRRERTTKIAPIVSSAKSVSVILRMWDRKHKTTADAVVIEGPLAGGHLGFSLEELSYYGAMEDQKYRRDLFDEEIKKIIEVVKEYEEKFAKKIPVIVAGGIYTNEDFLHALSLGADGVQVGTRFVTTKECDAPEYYKDAYIAAKKEDIRITKSPVGLPGRAIDNKFLVEVKKKRPEIKKCYQCLNKCDMTKIPYCITDALIKAATGDTENALLFAGSNAYRANKIETVKEVMDSICG
jgi:dioxygenases related to 2-nitropropane dioxygenase